MLILSSRSATVLVIFIVAVLAFCLANVFASMTGQISIVPNETESGGVLDNLSAITDDNVDNGNSYGYQDYNDYSSADTSSDDKVKSNIETTTDTSKNTHDSSKSSSSSQSSPSKDTPSSQKTSTGSNVETTTDSSSSGSSSIETATG